MMSKKKSPVSVAPLTGHDVKGNKSAISFTYVNFNDNTAERIFQVLLDLLCEQEGTEIVKLSLKKA